MSKRFLLSFIRCAVCFAGLLCLAGEVAAQSGALVIRVSDGTNPLPGATVTIGHLGGLIRTTSVLTDNDGVVKFPVLRPGADYFIEVQFPGYGLRRIPHIAIVEAQTRTLAVALTASMQGCTKDRRPREYENKLALAPGLVIQPSAGASRRRGIDCSHYVGTAARC